MKQERKEYLINHFPAVPYDIWEEMKGKGSANFAVLLTQGDELFARCFHRYSNGAIAERQRYVFAKDGYFRCGKADWEKDWQIRREFREPVFCQPCYGYYFNNSYILKNPGAIKNSCMKYSCADMYNGNALFDYLRLYCRHPNIEYLMKSGYGDLIDDEYDGFYGTNISVKVFAGVDFKSNNLLKMLGLNRTEFKALTGHEKTYMSYIKWREEFPEIKPADLVMLADTFGFDTARAAELSEVTGLTKQRIARYLSENNISLVCYKDNIEQCRKLGYDLHDTAISMPHDFNAMHERNSEALRTLEEERELRRKQRYDSGYLRDFYDDYVKTFAYSDDDYSIIVPTGAEDIVKEGAAQRNCVAGYAERHLTGKTIVLFLRKTSDIENSFGTLEIGKHRNGKYFFEQAYAAKNKHLPKDAQEWLDKWLDNVNERNPSAVTSRRECKAAV